MKSTEEMEAESAAAIKEAGVATELEMQEEKIPTFKTIEELSAYIKALVERPHSYGTCVYALSHASVAAFNFIASSLGVTGFQASIADLDILRHTRDLQKGCVVNFENLLYPQYSDKFRSFEQLVEDNKEWLKVEAKKKLESSPNAHPEVLAHWNKLAAL
jgi:hypothetical protein